jgi:subtilase family serine protease
LHRKWLTPQEYAQRFGVSAQDQQTVTQWLTQHGFTIDEIPAGGRSIVFSGTARQIRDTFGTEIHRYLRHGVSHVANASDIKIPKALEDVVAGVVSLSDFHSRPLSVRLDPVPAFTSGSAHYLAPADFHTIYDLKGLDTQGLTGSGHSIAVLGRSNISFSDYTTFRNTFGLKGTSFSTVSAGTQPGYVTKDELESDLDLEWAGAVASGATIKFVTAASTSSADGVVLAAQYAVNNNVADVISLSYGLCESAMGQSAVNYFDALWQQAASQGISVVVASGDSGTADCDLPTASSASAGQAINGMCSSAYATCVGGTQFADTASPSTYWNSSNGTSYVSALSYIPEMVWNESGLNGGTGLTATGGGASIFWSKPSWQNVAGVPADGQRDVPDVAMAAAGHDGYLVYSSDNATRTQTLYPVAGTSAAAPAVAGILALVNQKTGYRLGNANPTLYGLAARQASGGGTPYFHLITSGNNSVPGQTGFSASESTPNYNQATGLGSIDAGVLVSHWTDLLPPTMTTLSTSNAKVTTGASVTFTATVTGATSGNVQFADNGSNLGAAVALSNGVASYTSSALAAGVHSVTATFVGDPFHQPSQSSALSETVQAITSTAVSASATSLAAGQGITLTATVSGSTPSGSVQFKDGSANLGAAVSLSGTTATLSTNGLRTAGTHSITAVYSGDTINTSSSASAVSVSVTPAATGVSLSASPSSAAPNQAVTLTATVNGVSPTGNVNFTDNGANLGSQALSNGIAALTISTLSSGSHNLVATYVGDTNNQGSTSTTVVENIVAADTNADSPTLPQWASIMGGILLLFQAAWKQRRRTEGHQTLSRKNPGQTLAI